MILAWLKKRFENNVTTSNESVDVYLKASREAEKRYKAEEEKITELNSICPHCQSKNVVEKFIGYKYEGWAGGSTLEKCKHCSDCQTDWKIKKPNKVYTWDILEEWYDKLSEMIKYNRTSEDIFKACPYFNNIHAESFSKIYKFMYYHKTPKIKLKALKKIYKSL